MRTSSDDNEEFLGLLNMKFMGRMILCWCGKESKLMQFKSGKKVYVCQSCSTQHGAHQAYPHDPLGVPAEPEVRKLRRKCHVAMDRWRELHGWGRNRAYRELALLMNLSRERCHIGSFDHTACLHCIRLLTDESDFTELVGKRFGR